MKPIKFSKMHGLGNDFVVIDGISQDIHFTKTQIKQLAHRHLGIGCDQILLIQRSTRADCLCIIYNADGSEAEQCGNGMRCVARFVHENQIIAKPSLTIETKSGVVSAVIHDYSSIAVAMGTPVIDLNLKQLELSNHRILPITALSIGNPHVITRVDSVKDFPVATLGAEIATHAHFLKGTNVGFMEIIDPQRIRLRTYERGVGETYACGSNSCAAVVAGILHHSLKKDVTVELPFGELQVSWQDKDAQVILTGPAALVFRGEFDSQI